MMIRCLLFLAAFSLEVHVNAAERALQEPSGCIATKDVCAVENSDERGFELKLGETIVTLDRDASVIRKTSNEVRLVRGTIWVRSASTDFRVTSEFGVVRSLSEGQFWVTKTATDLTALATSTDVELLPRGSHETLLVSQGLQNTLGQIGFNGKAATGLPMTIPFKDLCLRWGRLYKGPKAEFEAAIARFRQTWEEAAEAAAEINKAVFDRKVASVEDAARANAEKQAKADAENQALRAMFRRRNGL